MTLLASKLDRVVDGVETYANEVRSAPSDRDRASDYVQFRNDSAKQVGKQPSLRTNERATAGGGVGFRFQRHQCNLPVSGRGAGDERTTG